MKLLIPLILALVLTGCTLSSYMSNTKDIKGSSVVIITPEQKCSKKNNGRILTGEKTLHPAHKECYYK